MSIFDLMFPFPPIGCYHVIVWLGSSVAR